MISPSVPLCRPSKADFISKMGTVEEEAGGTLFWLELIGDAKSIRAEESSATDGGIREGGA